MVGLGRLELPTSPLSGVRSNHLSYRPGRLFRYTAQYGGACRDRTDDPLLAKQVLSQLSYSPIQLDHPSLINQARQQFASTNSLNPNPHSHMQMVGPGRLELPTPRLSSVCSNQLSYKPGFSS